MNGKLGQCLVILAAAVTFAWPFGRATTTRGNQRVSPGDGAIEGKIFDNEGRPASGVSVYNVTLDHPLPARPRPSSTTIARSDQDGRFYIGSVSPGRYSIEYAKED